MTSAPGAPDRVPDRAPNRALVVLAAALLAVIGVGGLIGWSTRSSETETVAAATLPATPDEPDVALAAPAADPVVVPTEPPRTTTATTIAPTTSAPTASTTAPPTSTPVTTVTLPQPVDPPSDPRAYEEQELLGGIRIPKLGVEAPLLEGIRLTTIDNGPGHWPGSAMPGEVGNVVVAAHRTSHGGPFRHIDTLVAGDEVIFNTASGENRYLVTGTQIVEPNALWIVDPTDTPTATLFACHPPGSVAQRIVVNLELAP